jgi:(+)-pinoresinol hydroxylase
MKQTLLLLLVTGFCNSVAAQTASQTSGKIVFDKWCTPCHGGVAPSRGQFGGGALPGTSALAAKYQGKLPAVLDQRTDLTVVQIKSVVRHGLFGMPITRKTEVSDAELEDVAAYLTRNRKP